MSVLQKLFKSTDTGAPTLSGEVGKLTTILDECLVVKRVFSYNGSAFTDNSVEARLEGGTAFTAFPDNDTNDELYVIMQQPFEQVEFFLATLGVGGTRTAKYWNGAWTAIPSPTDGTSNFTQNGIWSWAIPGDWVTTTVNSVAGYAVKWEQSGASSTNPTIDHLTVTGWTVAFSGTNQRAYRMGSGSLGYYVNVNDNAPGNATVARARGYETMSALDTGTNLCPTAAQLANGMFWFKSATANATTRTWYLLADDRTFEMMFDGAGASNHANWGFGEFFSFIASDPGRAYITGQNIETSGSWTAVGGIGLGILATNTALTFGTNSSIYIFRDYTKVAGAILVGLHGDVAKQATAASMGGTVRGSVDAANPADGGYLASRFWIHEPTGASVVCIRGRLRGVWLSLHVNSLLTNNVVSSGSNDLASKTFLQITNMQTGASQATHTMALLLETIGSWETN